MRLNITSAPAKPCMRDLVHVVLAPQLLLSPLEKLAYRLLEVVAQQPRFREKAPLVLAGQEHRRR